MTEALLHHTSAYNRVDLPAIVVDSLATTLWRDCDTPCQTVVEICLCAGLGGAVDML